MRTLNKDNLIETLPLRTSEITIRQWNRDDMDKLAAWPKYPFPYEAFDFSFKKMNAEEKDAYFNRRNENPNMIITVVDHIEQPIIGYFAPHSINWNDKKIGNFGYRIMPSYCNKGIGTTILRECVQWLFEYGINTICLDVAASNSHAIRCYDKIGFVKTGEIWREDENLSCIDLADTRYDFLRPHVRFDQPVPRLCFWLMELTRNEQGKPNKPDAGDA